MLILHCAFSRSALIKSVCDFSICIGFQTFHRILNDTFGPTKRLLFWKSSNHMKFASGMFYYLVPRTRLPCRGGSVLFLSYETGLNTTQCWSWLFMFSIVLFGFWMVSLNSVRFGDFREPRVESTLPDWVKYYKVIVVILVVILYYSLLGHCSIGIRLEVSR